MRSSITVVVPTYRRPGLLREALSSLVAQTEQDFQVHVCDNDDDAEVRALVAGLHDPRFHYIGRPVNIGLFRNLLEGMRETRSEFVMNLDDDDYLEPDCLAALVAPLREHPQVSLAFAQFTLMDDAGSRLVADEDWLSSVTGRAGLTPGAHPHFTRLAVNGTIHLVAGLMRRSAVDWDGVPDEVGTALDLHMALQVARGGGVAFYLPVPMARYRYHEQSDSTRNLAAQHRGGLAAIECALTSGEHRDERALHEGFASLSVRLGRLLLRGGEVREARGVLRRSLMHQRSWDAARLLAVAWTPDPVRSRLLASREAVRSAVTPVSPATPTHV